MPAPESALYAEQQLLGQAMATAHGATVVQRLDPREFISDPRHEGIARAIVELHRARRPHDAHAVAAHMGRALDPGLRPKPELWVTRPIRGLESWQLSALPSSTAGQHAADIRTHYRQDQLGRVGDALSRAAARSVGPGVPLQDSTADVQARAMAALRKIPPPLDIGGPARRPTTVSTGQPLLPPRPILSSGSRVSR